MQNLLKKLGQEEEQKVRCHNPGCEVLVKQDTSNKIQDRPYCPDCYVYLKYVR